MSHLVTVTVLFTDLVDSTAQSTRVGQDAYEDLRRTHFAMLREAITAHGGTQVKNLGDGVMATFHAASEGVAAAVAIQQAADRHNRHASEPLANRIGMALGDVTEEDGDYFGAPVVQAARLCAAAAGGQILCTDVLRIMAGTHHHITPVGPLELKGIPGPVEAAMVEWSPAPGDVGGAGPGVRGQVGRVPLPPRLPPPALFGSFGRDEAGAALAQALKRAGAGEGHQVVFLSGEPGIGKTTLATDLCRTAHDEGATVLYGACDELVASPYRPFAEALSHLIAHLSNEVITEHVAAYGGELASLVPELTQRYPALPAARTADPEAERYLVFQSVVGLLSLASAEAPVILLVDDLHWADKPTLLLLRHLATSAGSAGTSRLLVIGTFRDSDRARTALLLDVLASLRRDPSTQRIALTGLDDAAVIALLEAAAGYQMEGTEVELARALRRETDGNPFFVTEVLRHVVESGKIRQNAGGRWIPSSALADAGIPQSLHEVVGQRVARLGDDGTRVLGAAAVIGQEFDLDVLSQVTDLEAEALLDLLEAAAAAALVEDVPARPGRFRFAQNIIQEALYQETSTARRAQTHGRVAEALEQLYRDHPGEHLPELARHWAATGRTADLPRAIGYARHAGEAALAGLAPDEAVRWFTHARSLSRDLPGRQEPLEIDLLIGLGTAQRQAGDPAHRQTLLDAAALAQRLGDTRRLVAAALANNRGTFTSGGTVDAEKVQALRAALAGIGAADSAERALLLVSLAVELEFTDQLDERRGLADQALTIARRLNQPDVLARILNLRFYAINVPDTLSDRLAGTAESLALARSSGDPLLRFWAARLRVFACIQAGDIEEVDRHLAELSTLADQLGQPWLRYLSLSNRAWRVLLAGGVEESESLATRSFEIALDIGNTDAIPSFGGQLYAVRRYQGRLGELIEILVKVMADNPRLVVNRAALAAAYCELDRDEEARDALAAEAAGAFASLPYDSLWLTGMRLWAEVATHVGDTGAAAVLYERLAPFHSQVAFSPGALGGSVAHCLGSLAGVLGRLDDADAHYREASAVYGRLASPYHQAALNLDMGRLLLRREGADGPGRARALLNLARELAASVGNPTIDRRASALLADLGPG